MKLHHKIVTGAVALMAGSMAFTACTDPIKFGDAFIEKTPGGTVSLDTVFNSAEYTKQFLVGLYVTQYYGLPFKNATVAPWSASYWNTTWPIPTIRSSPIPTTMYGRRCAAAIC